MGIHVYHLRNGMKLCLRSRTVDFFVVDEVVRRRVYLPSPDWIRPTDVVVDAGAHVGAYTVMASKLASRGRVLAIEPHPENFRMLRENVEINHCHNVIAAPLALATHSGQSKLFVSPYNTGGHSFYLRSSRHLDVATVNLRELMDRFDLPRIDVLKLDIEGAEHEILQSTPEPVLQQIRKINLECHNVTQGRDTSSLVRGLREAGFEVLPYVGDVISAQRAKVS